MGFFKKIGKLAKKRLNFKHLVKMANPLNVLNPLGAIKNLKNDFKDVKSLFVDENGVPQYTPEQIRQYQEKVRKQILEHQKRLHTKR